MLWDNCQKTGVLVAVKLRKNTPLHLDELSVRVVRFEVFTAETTENAVFLDAT
jgi:hypothetical protein